jgi:hypothetical protein
VWEKRNAYKILFGKASSEGPPLEYLGAGSEILKCILEE